MNEARCQDPECRGLLRDYETERGTVACRRCGKEWSLQSLVSSAGEEPTPPTPPTPSLGSPRSSVGDGEAPISDAHSDAMHRAFLNLTRSWNDGWTRQPEY